MRYGCWIGFAGPKGLGVRMCFKGAVNGVVGLVEMCRKVSDAGDIV
jgi:hypothetical protein